MPVVTLAGGRRLSYAQAGPDDGRPVLVLHGAIGSPLRPSPELAAAIQALGLRYLMVSRPGFGGSDPSPGRSLVGFAHDLAGLAEVLGLARVAVVGVSAGGPYAIACAHAIPDRVAAVATVSSPSPAFRPWAAPGTAPGARVALATIAAAPGVTTAVGNVAAGLVRRHPRLLLRAMTLGADAGDRELLDDPPRAVAAVDGFLAATATGVGGLMDDYVLSTRPWGFALADVRAEVQLWHGTGDRLVPPVHAVHLAAGLPRHRLTLAPADGHFFFRRRLLDILSPLAAALAGPGPGRDATDP
ncbi:hypothetical protein DSM112329_01856 [Paraconexibacter sp. AEG42_29]|uniref:AB hydrolase-1 domain-containing protein n=1 Tax=Paraconexibacter sp. AEG42_29 TaxID=2997339 RepID=A0AAU7ATP5_9ACTN